MKNLSMIVWVTQLGLSIVLPLAGFVLLAVWLHHVHGWGSWVIWAGVVLGVICAVEGLRSSLKAMDLLAKEKPDQQSPVSFNDHD